MGCKMLKQAMGKSFPGEPECFSRLVQPDAPLVITRYGSILPNLFCGQMVDIAIMPIHGFN